MPEKNYQKKTTKVANIKAKKKVEDLTAYVVIGLLSWATGGAFGFLYGVAASLIKDATGTNSKALSSKIKVYYPKGGQNIGRSTYVIKYVGTFYAKKNYKGKHRSKTYYKVRIYHG